MNTFAFNSKEKIKKHYASLLKRMKKHANMRDLIKVGGLIVALVCFLFMYLYFVNRASTRGYFLRQAMQRRTSVAFQQEIIKTQLLKVRQQNREKLADPSMNTMRLRSPEVVRIQIPVDASWE